MKTKIIQPLIAVREVTISNLKFGKFNTKGKPLQTVTFDILGETVTITEKDTLTFSIIIKAGSDEASDAFYNIKRVE